MKTKSSRKESDTDWGRLVAMKDSEIDHSDSPELDSSFFANATIRMPEPKKAVSLRLDPDVLDWYKTKGPGYQTRINAVLRMYMQAKSATVRRRTVKRLVKKCGFQ